MFYRLRIAFVLFAVSVLLAGIMILPLSGCSREEQKSRGPAEAGETVIEVWCHQGRESENEAMRAMVAAFNEAHAGEGVRVEIEFFPDAEYTNKIYTAAAAGTMPDVFDLDGPLLASFVDSGLLQPLDQWVDAGMREDFIPTILEQGTVNDKLYALGAFDSALVLYYDKEMLDRAGVTPPPELEAWTWDGFLSACEKLKQAGMDPVALHMDDKADEWYTYAFSPVVWSNGGRLISEDGATVEGVLDARENVEALTRWKQIFDRDYAARAPVDPDPFGAGKTAMDWTGHWMAPSHIENKGEALGAMPLPKAGPGKVAPSGSWCWGISSETADPESAAMWLKWVVHPEHGVEPMVRANGAVPARKSAFAAFPEYEEMPYKLFRAQLEGWARSRPKTPQYATVTQHFAAAVRDIAQGDDPQSRLQDAATRIQRVLDRQKEDR